MTTPVNPASGTNNPVSREESVKRILDIIKAYDFSRSKPVEDAKKQLATYSDSTIAIILTAALHKNHQGELLNAVINETDEQTVREVMYLYPHCHRVTAPKERNITDMIGIIRGLHRIERYKDVALDTLTGEDLAIATAFLNVTSAVLRNFENPHLHFENPDDNATMSVHIANTAVQALIVKYHYKVEDFIAFLTGEGGFLIPERRAISGLPHLRWYKKQDPRTVTEETIDHGISYLRITKALQGIEEPAHLTRSGADWNYSGVHLWNEPFEAIVDQHYKNTDAIIEYIEKRGSADPELLRLYLENETALKSGVL